MKNIHELSAHMNSFGGFQNAHEFDFFWKFYKYAIIPKFDLNSICVVNFKIFIYLKNRLEFEKNCVFKKCFEIYNMFTNL